MTKQEEILPCNIKSSEVDKELAESILKDNKNYIVRYLRRRPTVGLAIIPASNEAGVKVVDGPTTIKRVICSGIPYACMIAFMHQSQLLIGWSKRIESRKLLETRDLHTLFRKVLTEAQGVDEASETYKDAFGIFCQSLMNVLSYSPAKDIEVSFAKTAGKVAAIIRGINDSTFIHGKYVVSAASGPVPHDIARNLGQFIEQAENVYGDKATNVEHKYVELASISPVGRWQTSWPRRNSKVRDEGRS